MSKQSSGPGDKATLGRWLRDPESSHGAQEGPGLSLGCTTSDAEAAGHRPGLDHSRLPVPSCVKWG